MSIKEQYKLAYRVTRIVFYKADADVNDFIASWTFWGIPYTIGIAALKSYDYSLTHI